MTLVVALELVQAQKCEGILPLGQCASCVGACVIISSMNMGPEACCEACQRNTTCTGWVAEPLAGTHFSCRLKSNVSPKPRACSNPSKANWTFGIKPTKPAPTPPPTPLPPYPKGAMNVLMIAIDDMRPENSAYGFTYMHTPHIQKLANR
jgi:hypothetical protein